MTALERHFRVGEIAQLWGLSETTIINLFRDEPGVLRMEGPGGKRKYTTLSIPQSVAVRVHERMSQRQATGHQPKAVKVIRVSDFRRAA